jgi:hypothetical protein
LADLPSVRDKILEEETDFDSPLTEVLHQKIGADINYLIDERDSLRSDIDTNTSDITALQGKPTFELEEITAKALNGSTWVTIASSPSGTSLLWANLVISESASATNIGNGALIGTSNESLYTYSSNNYRLRISANNLQAIITSGTVSTIWGEACLFYS